MGYHREGLFSDLIGAIATVLGVLSQLYIGRQLRFPRWLNYATAIVVGGYYVMVDQQVISKEGSTRVHFERTVFSECAFLFFIVCIGTALCLLLRNRIPSFTSERRHFLRASSAAACAVPAAVFGFGVITRKDFKVREVDVAVRNLHPDLAGLRIVQISDIHLGPFFTEKDLVRVIDASNNLKPDLAFVTGDLITDAYDPLERCLLELRKLKAWSGIWGCMGNHEWYSHLESYTQARARELDIFFLRQQAQLLRFGKARLNLIGVDYHPGGPYLAAVDPLIVPGDFNLLLAHTPEVFPEAAAKKFDLTLSGHTHGGQLNIDVLGTNFNVVELRTPYTRGIYKKDDSTIFVNSGLGTIGVPARIGAPAEIALIRLCAS